MAECEAAVNFRLLRILRREELAEFVERIDAVRVVFPQFERTLWFKDTFTGRTMISSASRMASHANRLPVGSMPAFRRV